MRRIGSRSPDFLILGAQKCGTKALRSFLSMHPNLYLYPKEIHFFSSLNRYSCGLEWYKQHFSDVDSERLVGEKSPDYLYCRGSAERIKTLIPHSRLIILLRNPVQRAYSHYCMSVKNFREPLRFSEALQQEKWRIDGSATDWIEYGSNRWKYSYIDRGLYSRQIEQYLKYFKEDRLLFLLQEDLKCRPFEVLRRVYRFLGVSAKLPELSDMNIVSTKKQAPLGAQKLLMRVLFESSSIHTRNLIWRILPSAPIAEIDSATQQNLEEIFYPEIERIASLLGKDFLRLKNESIIESH